MSHRPAVWTPRLLIRAPRKVDLDGYTGWLWDPEAMRFWSATPAHTKIEYTQEYIHKIVASSLRGDLAYSVCLRDPAEQPIVVRDRTGQATSIIGHICLGEHQHISFIFNRRCWKRGYAFEALDAFIKYVWSACKHIEYIVADVDPRNEACLRLLGKLGFLVVGKLSRSIETHEGWCDSVYLEIERPLSPPNNDGVASSLI